MSEITDKHMQCAEELISSSINDRMAKRQRAAKVIAKHFPEPMTEAKAREILGDWIGSGGDYLCDLTGMVIWQTDSKLIHLERVCTAEELEAVAFWMRNKNKA